MCKLRSLQVWDSQYDITLINAEGQGNLFARYQSYEQSDSFEAIFLITDTDSKPYEHYLRLKAKLNRHHHRRGVAQQLLIYGNPCTMQFILLHWARPEQLHLISPAKHANAQIIHQLLGIRHYHARRSQRKKLCALITGENYSLMVERAQRLKQHDRVLGSSNFSILMHRLESQPSTWLAEHEDLLY